jgi:hypothetical protein
MERMPGNRPNSLEKTHLEIDREGLEPQLEKASEILLDISEHNSFSTFSHFGKLAEAADAAHGSPASAIELLSEWNYDSLDFIKKGGHGNCVDFAILGQKMLLDSGIPTTIIGKIPEKDEYSQEQIDFMHYRHTSLLYANESEGNLKLFMFEPGWKFPRAITIDPGVVSGNEDWRFETLGIDGGEFTQRTYYVHKKKYGERVFDTRPLGVDYCQNLTKRLIRVPRKLELVNRLVAGVPTCYVRFDPRKETLTTNIVSIGGEFLPEHLSTEQRRLLDDSFEQPEVADYFVGIIKFWKSLPPEFWVTGS